MHYFYVNVFNRRKTSFTPNFIFGFLFTVLPLCVPFLRYTYILSYFGEKVNVFNPDQYEYVVFFIVVLGLIWEGVMWKLITDKLDAFGFEFAFTLVAQSALLFSSISLYKFISANIQDLWNSTTVIYSNSSGNGGYIGIFDIVFLFLLYAPFIFKMFPCAFRSYLRICETKKGYIIFRPLNFILYPLNIVLEKRAVKMSSGSCRFIYKMGKRSSWASSERKQDVSHNYGYVVDQYGMRRGDATMTTTHSYTQHGTVTYERGECTSILTHRTYTYDVKRGFSANGKTSDHGTSSYTSYRYW